MHLGAEDRRLLDEEVGSVEMFWGGTDISHPVPIPPSSWSLPWCSPHSSHLSFLRISKPVIFCHNHMHSLINSFMHWFCSIYWISQDTGMVLGDRRTAVNKMENICSLGAVVAMPWGNQIYKHGIQYAGVDGCWGEQIEQDKEGRGNAGARVVLRHRPKTHMDSRVQGIKVGTTSLRIPVGS